MSTHPTAQISRLLLGLALALALPWQTLAEASQAPAAQQRLQSAMAATLERDLATAVRARLSSQRASTRAETSPGGPTAEWQTEGLETGGDDATSSVHSLRLSKEVQFPTQRRRSKDYLRQSDQAFDARQRVELLELAATTGRDWLDYAATLEHRALASHRLERLDRALDLHRERLRLGEVAGAEVRQLELQQAQDRAQLAHLKQRLDLLAGRLRHRAGDIPLPGKGDLRSLAAELPALADDLSADAGPRRALADATQLASERRSLLLRHTAWGLPELEVESQRTSGRGSLPSFETFGLRIAVPLPLGAQGRARRAAAVAAAEAERAQSQSTVEEIEVELDLISARVRSSEAMLEQLAPVAKDLANTELSLAEQFRLGAISYLVYIDGLSRLDELRSDLLESRLTLLKARLDLATLVADNTIFPIPSIH